MKRPASAGLFLLRLSVSSLKDSSLKSQVSSFLGVLGDSAFSVLLKFQTAEDAKSQSTLRKAETLLALRFLPQSFHLIQVS